MSQTVLPEIDPESRPEAPRMQKPREDNDEPQIIRKTTDNEPLADDEDNEEPAQPWVTNEDLAVSRNVRWRRVIELRMDGKNMTEAYGIAYDIPYDKDVLARNVAAANGSALLRNPKFQALWDRVNMELGFTDQMADYQLLDLINNPATEPAVKRAAINDYNKLRGRQIDRVDHTTKGKAIETPAIISAIKPRDETAAQTEAADGN